MAVYLTHYEVMKSERSRLELFLRTRKVAIILDEAHKMKNPASEVTQSLFKLASGFRRRVVMTGTPVANRPYDLWAPIFFLDGGQSLGVDFDAFRQALDLSNDMFEKSEKTDRFESQLASVFVKIRPFTVRETKLGADIQLPEKHISNVTVEMESRQAELSNLYTDEFASVLIKSGNQRNR
jgi:SNF2 family DNA or RNA helicase